MRIAARRFQFRSWPDVRLHIALEVDLPVLALKLADGRARGIETRGIADHGFIRSI